MCSTHQCKKMETALVALSLVFSFLLSCGENVDQKSHVDSPLEKSHVDSLLQEGYAVEMWDISGGQRIHRMFLPNAEFSAAAPLLSADASKIAARKGDSIVIVEANGDPAHPLLYLSDPNLRLVPDRFAAGGASLVTRVESKVGQWAFVRLYGAVSGKMVTSFPAEEWEGLYSPDSRYAAVLIGMGYSLPNL